MKASTYSDALAALPPGNRAALIDYLRAESRLPGPRANLELAYAAMEIIDCDDAIALADIPLDENPTTEFVVTVGAMGLGRCYAEGKSSLVLRLRTLATSASWRVREGVAMALQRIGDANPEELDALALEWAGDRNRFIQRAAAAAIAEPRLLKNNPALAHAALIVMQIITGSMVGEPDPRSDEYVALRKAMGYAWSVAIVAAPEVGKSLFEQWAASADRQVQWVVRENLKKDRLRRLDAAWVDAVSRKS